MAATQSQSLRSRLVYQPQELKFGTSGRRGRVEDLTQLEVYINTLAELRYLQSLAPSEGGIRRGDEFFFACDLRPSSTAFVEEQGGRGEIAQAIAIAIRDAGMRPVYLGRIPTPALTSYALSQSRGSIMVTGSHIPFDRNGYKTNTSRGELLKQHEAPIGKRVGEVRKEIYAQPYEQSAFNEYGLLKAGHQSIPEAAEVARQAYIDRFTSFFGRTALAGLRLLVYEHSAVGRDLLVQLLRQLGAEVIPAGRSDTFVPIDTENIDDAQLSVVQKLADEAAAQYGPINAVVSTDGDSDRPLILGIDPFTNRVRFFGGDLVGMIVARYLNADAVVVPITCNDAIDRGELARVLEPKTRIGSPFVIAGMAAALAKGKRRVCGWEANGGFLTGSDIERNGLVLKALPTRDAVLPIVGVLSAAKEAGLSLVDLFARLPRRFSRAALLKQFPRPVSLAIVEYLSPRSPEPDAAESGEIRRKLAQFFSPEMGFGAIGAMDYTDGVRVLFDNGDVAHIRPSGNADELRIYAVADTQERADAIVASGIAEPDGILRRMESYVRGHQEPVLKLNGAVQHYEWGGFEFIPRLLGIDNSEQRPFAELWIGAHPKAPATAETTNGPVPLDRLIATCPEKTLGPQTAARFDRRLPYLFKVLDARKMLSIQAHPTKKQAEEGFARENEAGIAANAPERNYKDDNHKPEVHVALTEFWMLHGFRPLEQIAQTLSTVPELNGIFPEFSRRLERAGADGEARRTLLRDLYGAVMTMPQEQIDGVLHPLLARLAQATPSDKTEPDYWALRAAENFPLPDGRRDRGIISIYLLNLVHLRPGQGTFQPAGVLHAYLEGVNVELMANSDNVLRGGLTPKHVDVPELMRTLGFSSGAASVLDGEPAQAGECVYRTPAAEFELSRIEIGSGRQYTGVAAEGPDSVIVLKGPVTVSTAAGTTPFSRGGVFFAPYGARYTIEACASDALVFKASVPAEHLR